MILSKRVALGKENLDELDESIVIRSVDPGQAKETVGSVSRMGGWGSRMTNQHWDSRDVSVTFAINIYKKEMARRREVFDKVVAWANRKGWLTTNQMDGKRIWVEKTEIPNGGDMWEWLNEYTITFRTFGVPFWQSQEPAEVRKDKMSKGSVIMDVGGTAPNTLEVRVENISGAENTNIKIWVGSEDRALEFKGAKLAASENLVLEHATDGKLKAYAEKNGTKRNLYSLLRGLDDTYVEPGAVEVGVSSTRAVNLIVQSYARWL